jgi:hypothetical protein
MENNEAFEVILDKEGLMVEASIASNSLVLQAKLKLEARTTSTFRAEVTSLDSLGPLSAICHTLTDLKDYLKRPGTFVFDSKQSRISILGSPPQNQNIIELASLNFKLMDVPTSHAIAEVIKLCRKADNFQSSDIKECLLSMAICLENLTLARAREDGAWWVNGGMDAKSGRQEELRKLVDAEVNKVVEAQLRSEAERYQSKMEKLKL